MRTNKKKAIGHARAAYFFHLPRWNSAAAGKKYRAARDKGKIAWNRALSNRGFYITAMSRYAMYSLQNVRFSRRGRRSNRDSLRWNRGRGADGACHIAGTADSRAVTEIGEGAPTMRQSSPSARPIAVVCGGARAVGQYRFGGSDDSSGSE